MPFLDLTLGDPTRKALRSLCRAIWLWSPCVGCEGGGTCEDIGCPIKRMQRLGRFLDFYRNLSASYEPELAYQQVAAIESHRDVAELVIAVQSMSDITRAQCVVDLFKAHPNKNNLSMRDCQMVLNMIIRVIYMVDCTGSSQPYALLEFGAGRRCWQDDATFCEFMMSSFPTADQPEFNEPEVLLLNDINQQLSARKLKRYLGVHFRPTDDLRSHLRFDRRTNTVDIFHHTAFLKEHLRRTKGRTDVNTFGETLKIGALPRQLALEVLDSIQKVLFPITDAASHSLLKSLVSKSWLDPDCLRFESASIRKDSEKDISYLYFGARLAELCAELEDPSPRGGLEKWLQRRSGARHAMLATLIGVFVAVLLGFASLGVSIYQSYIQYQAWQHPVIAQVSG